VIGMVSIFNYGFPIAKQEFEKKSINYCSLTDYPTILALSLQKGTLSEPEYSVLQEWQKDPAGWKQ